MIYILDKNLDVVESLSNEGALEKITPFFDDTYTQLLASGAETYTFSTLSNSNASKYLVVGNYVAFKYQNDYKLFHISEVRELHAEDFIKTVYCETAGIELINEIVRPVELTEVTARQVLEKILETTEWVVGTMDASLIDTSDVSIEQYSSVYSCIQEYIVNNYGAEVSFSVKMNKGRITHKLVNVYKNRGRAKGVVFSYSSNITSVSKNVNASEVYTAMIGCGKDGITFKELVAEDKPAGLDYVVDEEALKRWGRNGNHILGVFEADTDKPEKLLDLTRKALSKYNNPKITYELNVEMLDENVSIGDTVRVVDHEFNPPLYLEARVSELNISFSDSTQDSCVLSNFVELTSNITSEMKKLASTLKGYVNNTVESRFPIQEEDIDDEAVHGKHIYKNSISTQHLSAELIEAVEGKFDKITADVGNFKELLATKAEIEDLEATIIRVEDLEANSATIEDLNVTKAEIEEAIINRAEITDAEIENLKANKAEIEDLRAATAEIGQLKADTAHIGQLTADVGKIQNLVSGNISSGNIQTGGITGDNLNMDTIFVRDANILDLSASKLTAGEINTSKIAITSEDGGILLVGNTQQFLDENGNVRIQLGRDAKGNFDFFILDNEGEILFNPSGITGNAIANGLIKNDMIGTGQIGGDKINWQSFATEFNKETNTTTLNSSKIILDGTNQSLNVHFNRVQETVDELGRDVNETNKTVSSHTTQINTQQGKIDTLIQDTTIVKDGVSTTLKDAYNKTVATVNSLSSTIGNQETEINELTGEVEATTTKVNNLTRDLNETQLLLQSTTTTANNTSSQVSEIKQNYNQISSRLESIEDFKTDTQKTLNTQSSQINQLADSIELKVSQSHFNEVKNELVDSINNKAEASNVYTKAETNSQISAAKDAINLSVSEKYETKENVTTKINTAVSTIQLGGRNLAVGTSDTYISNSSFSGIANDCKFPYKVWNKGLSVGDKVTVSCKFKYENLATSNTSSNTIRIQGSGDVTAWNSGSFNSYSIPITFGETVEKNIVYTFAINENHLKNNYWSINFRTDHITSGKIYVKEFQVEKGEKQSAWTQAPEDLHNAINDKANSSEVYKKSETYTKTETDSAIKVAKDEINLGVSQTYETKSNVITKVNEAINGVQIGGRNLFLNSGFTKGLNYWQTYNCSNPQAIADSSALSGYAVKFTSTGGGIYQRKGGVPNNPTNYPSGSVMTVSGYVKSSVAGKILRPNFENAGTNTSKNITCTNANTWYYFTHTYKIASNGFSTVTFYGDSGADYYLKDVILEYGNKASTWTQAPEDVQGLIDSKANTTDVYKKTEVYTKTETNSQINIAKESIELGVSSKYETKESVDSKITTAVATKADSSSVYTKTETDSAINVAKEAIELGVKNTYETKANVSTALGKKADSSSVYTKAETDSAINVAREAIELGVKNTYETKTNVSTALNGKANVSDVYTKAQTDAAISLGNSGVLTTVKDTYLTKSDATNTYATQSSLQQTSNGIIASFKSTGGYNLIRNSTGANNSNSNWSYTCDSLSATESTSTIGGSSYYLYMNNGTNTQTTYANSKRFKLKPSTKYTLTGYFLNYTKSPSFSVDVLWSSSLVESSTSQSSSGTITLLNNADTNGSWKKFTTTFTAPSNAKSGYLRIAANGYDETGTGSNYVCWNALILHEGDTEMPWSSHPSEIYDGYTSIDSNGIIVKNGGLTIKNNSGTTVFQGDTSGNLQITGTMTGSNFVGGTIRSTNDDLYFDLSRGYMVVKNSGTRIGQTLKNNIVETSIYGMSTGAEYGNYATLAAKATSSAANYTMYVTVAGKDLTSSVKKGVNFGGPINFNNYVSSNVGTLNCAGNIVNPNAIIWDSTKLSTDEARIYAQQSNSESSLYLRIADDDVDKVKITCNHASAGHCAIAYFGYNNTNKSGIDFYRSLNMNGYAISNSRTISTVMLEVDDINFSSPSAISRFTSSDEEEAISLKPTKTLVDNIEHFGSAKVINGECVIELPHGFIVGEDKYVVILSAVGNKKIWVEEKDFDYFKVCGEDCEFDYVIKCATPNYFAKTLSIKEDDFGVIKREHDIEDDIEPEAIEIIGSI